MPAPIPPPPSNSKLTLEYTEEGDARLSWPLRQERGCARFGAAGFLGFWLCGWAAGETFAIIALVGMCGFGPMEKAQQVAQGPGWLAVLFLAGWLGLWTIGGVSAMLTVYTMLRGPQPNHLILRSTGLTYQPDLPTAKSGHWTYPNATPPTTRLPWQRRKIVNVPRAELGPIRLRRIAGDQELTIDHGAERVEIGSELTEPEREWLAAVLRTWAGQNVTVPEEVLEDDDSDDAVEGTAGSS